MKVKQIAALLFSSIISTSIAFADNAAVINPKPIVDQAINQLMEKDHIPGVAVELYVNGVPYSYQYGYRDLHYKAKVNDKTLFEIGSLSKLFTCLLFAIEVDQNTLHMNDTLGQYLPSLYQTTLPASKLTLEQLATQTSGLPLNPPFSLNFTPNINTVTALHHFLSNWQPNSAPGSQWLYSNLGMGLLGISIENKVGWPYPELVNTYIFKPLKIKDAGVNVVGWRYNYAQGYDNGRPAIRWKMPLFSAAGGIEASPRDMLQFLGAALELPGTPKNIVAAMEQTQSIYVSTPIMQQGLGWEIYPYSPNDPSFTRQPPNKNLGPLQATQAPAGQISFNPEMLMQKTGATNGFSSFIGVVPNTHTGIVILCNSYFNDGDIVNTGRSILSHLIKQN